MSSKQSSPYAGWPPTAMYAFGAAVAASSLESGRISLAGFAVHPYLVLIGVCIVVLRTRWEPSPRWAFSMIVGSSVLAAFALAIEFNVTDSIKLLAVGFTLRILPIVTKTPAAVRASMLGFIWTLCLVVLFALATADRGFYGEIVAFSSGNKNTTALYVVPAVAFAAALLRRRETSMPLRVGLLGAMLSFVWLALNSGNRAAFVGLGFVFMAPALLTDQRGSTTRRLRRIAWVGVSGLVGSLLVNAGPAIFVDRLFGRSFNSTGELRVEILRASGRLFEQSPLVGFGPAGFRTQLAETLGRPQGLSALESHNLYLFMVGSFGLVGILTGLALARALYRAAWRGELLDPVLGKAAVVLFGLQALFTAEVLFAPPFLLLLINGLAVPTDIESGGTNTTRQQRSVEPQYSEWSRT